MRAKIEIQKTYKKFQESLGGVKGEKLQAYIYIILTLFAVSFFGLFAIGPTLNTVSNLNRQYEDNVLVYEALTQKLANLRLLDAQFETLEGNLISIYAAIPKSARIPYLTRQLENLAAGNNLRITEFNIGTVEIFPNSKEDLMYSFLFNIGVVGERADVNNFLKDVLGFDRIIGIERISTGVNMEKQFNMRLAGRVFFAAK